LDNILLGTITVVLDGPELHGLSAKECEAIAEGFVDQLRRVFVDRGYAEVQLTLVSASAGCIKAKIAVAVSIVSLGFTAATFMVTFVDKYPNLKATLPAMIADAGIAFDCKLRGRKVACKAMHVQSATTKSLYRVKKGDTLSQIVIDVWKVSISRRKQVMRATVINNPHAFVDGDMNRLKTDSALMEPTEEMLKGIR